MIAARWIGRAELASAALAFALVIGGRATRESAPQATTADAPLQAAVLVDGFTVVIGPEGDRRVLELGPEGVERRQTVLRLPSESRVVGTRGGAVAGWRDRKRFAVARVVELERVKHWGKDVRRLCDGVASNDHRFGIGWLEASGEPWLVWGPVQGGGTKDEVPARPVTTLAVVPRATWCGMASAGELVAIAWNERDKLFFNRCDTDGCHGLAARAPLATDELVAMGCLRDGCAFASQRRDVAWTEWTSRVRWRLPLPGATADSPVSIVGAGDRALAVGYTATDGATVVRITQDGALRVIWRDPYATSSPVLAWSKDRLLIAHRHGETVSTETIDLPR